MSTPPTCSSYTTYAVTWLYKELEQNLEQRDSKEGEVSVRMLDISINRLSALEETRYGTLRYYPRIDLHDLAVCTLPMLKRDAAAQQICGPVVITCGFDTMATAMRMRGVGRLVYDACGKPSVEQTKVTSSLTLLLLRAD
ncbi:hypothetical protein KCU93_g7730, partial [Aureobasidium melanogenum]